MGVSVTGGSGRMVVSGRGGGGGGGGEVGAGVISIPTAVAVEKFGRGIW